MFTWIICSNDMFKCMLKIEAKSKYQFTLLLIFLKSGNTFDYMKNLRNAKINDPKNKQKHPA